MLPPVPGMQVAQIIGQIDGSVFRNVPPHHQDLSPAEAHALKSDLANDRRHACSAAIAKALALGANAVLGLKYDSSAPISQTKVHSALLARSFLFQIEPQLNLDAQVEICAYGTAAIVVPTPPPHRQPTRASTVPASYGQPLPRAVPGWGAGAAHGTNGYGAQASAGWGGSQKDGWGASQKDGWGASQKADGWGALQRANSWAAPQAKQGWSGDNPWGAQGQQSGWGGGGGAPQHGFFGGPAGLHEAAAREAALREAALRGSAGGRGAGREAAMRRGMGRGWGGGAMGEAGREGMPWAAHVEHLVMSKEKERREKELQKMQKKGGEKRNAKEEGEKGEFACSLCVRKLELTEVSQSIRRTTTSSSNRRRNSSNNRRSSKARARTSSLK